MRIDLSVAYAEKEQAKALGARWDDARKIWYVVDPKDVRPFMRWIKNPRLRKPVNATVEKRKKNADSIKRKQEKRQSTTKSVVTVQTCNCNVPPWEDCEHTDALAQQEMEKILTGEHYAV